MFHGAQHAREWISAEVVRRGYPVLPRARDRRRLGHPRGPRVDRRRGSSRCSTRTATTTRSRRARTRLWRKNLRDNNNNGTIAVGDGIDTNRNFSEKWRYDNEGASDTTSSDTYRGPSPRVRAGGHARSTTLMHRIKPEFYVDYHSYAHAASCTRSAGRSRRYGGDTPI